jgi:MFS transporter, putative metabolite:H+ symporter
MSADVSGAATSLSEMTPEVSAEWKKFRVSKKETRRGTILAFFAWTLAVFDFILFGTMLPEIQESFGWTDEMASSAVTAIAVGTALTVFLMGPITDRLGRRKGMMTTVGITAIASAATAATTNFASLVAVRSLGGVGSGEQAVNTTYLNEIYALSEDETVTKRRGFIYGFVQSGWPIGALLAAGFAAIISQWFDWRATFLLATAPALIVLFMRRGLKETPQFLVQKKLRELRKSGKNEEADAFAAKYGLANVHHGSIRELFSPENRRNTITLSIAYFLSWFGIQTFSVLGTTILTKGLGVSFSNALLIVVVSNLIAAGGYIFHGWIGDKFGRKKVVVIGWFLSSIFFSTMLFVPMSTPMIILAYGFGLFFLIGPYSALVFYMGESFTSNSRATGAALVTAIGQPGAILASALITLLLVAGAGWSLVAFYVGVIGILLSAVAMLGTKKETVIEVFS